jgi:hypothetical protein
MRLRGGLLLGWACVGAAGFFSCTNTSDCTLSGECVGGACVCDKPWTGERCEQLKLKPAELAVPFSPARDQNHFTWGAAPFYAVDGRVCLLFTWLTGWADGNDTRAVPTSDTTSGSLGLACAERVAGPYDVLQNVSFPFRPGHYDAAYVENAVLLRTPAEGGGYLLAYTTSPPGVARNTLNWEGNGDPVTGLQYMGLAFAKDPLAGPWERLNRTILEPAPGGFERGIAINPAVLAFADGSLSVAYRGARDDGFGGCRMRSWREPCVRPPVNPFGGDPRWVKAEDPFAYRGPRGYIMISHTFRHPPYASAGSGTKAYSLDGVHWTWAGYHAYNYTMVLTNGTELSFFRREEPKLLLSADGQPTALFNVVDDSFLYNNTRIIVQELDYS